MNRQYLEFKFFAKRVVSMLGSGSVAVLCVFSSNNNLQMWQNIYYASSKVFTTRPFVSKILTSPTLCVHPAIPDLFPLTIYWSII